MNGFLEGKLTPQGGIVYRNSDISIELNYQDPLFPVYTFSGAITAERRKLAERASFSFVPMWYVISRFLPNRRNDLLAFRSREELLVLLSGLKNELFEAVIIPLVRDKKALDDLMTDYSGNRHYKR